MADQASRPAEITQVEKDVQAYVDAFVPMIRKIVSEAPTHESRKQVWQLWGQLRGHLKGVLGEKERVQNELATALKELESAGDVARWPVAPQARPATTESVAMLRQLQEQAMDVALEETLENTSTTINSIKDLDPVWVLDRLISKRNLVVEQETDAGSLGCWFSNNVPSSEYGYVKFKLTIPNAGAGSAGEGRKINAFGHQWAIVASGAGHMLPLTTKEGTAAEKYHVSHLCHRSNCFRPSHVVVETALKNQSRKGCGHTTRVVLRTGSRIDPCPCDADGSNFCILPTMELDPFRESLKAVPPTVWTVIPGSGATHPLPVYCLPRVVPKD